MRTDQIRSVPFNRKNLIYSELFEFVKVIKGVGMKIKQWNLTTKLVLAFVLVVMVQVFFMAFSYVNTNKIIKQYNLALQNNKNLEDLFDSVTLSNQYLKNYFIYGIDERLIQYLSEYNKSFRLINEMKAYVDDEYSYSKLTDLERMMKTYGEYANEAIYLRAMKKTRESYDQLDKATDANQIIVARYGFFASIINDNAESKRLDFLASQKATNALEIMLIIGLILFCAIFSGLFINNITKNIKKLVNSAKQVSKGDFDIPPVEINSNDEVALLSEVFNTMIMNIRYYVKEIEVNAELQKKLMREENKNLRTEALLKQTKINALYSKINPHFLFNTLNIIKQTAYLEHAEETRIMIETTAQLLRFYLDKSGMSVSLREELESVEDYVYIQNKRFGRRLKIEIVSVDEVSNIQIPSLIIQPLLENAIIHGLHECVGDGKITVQVEEQAESIIIRVQDNGKGIEPAMIDAILNKTYNGKQNSIGIGNVVERLELFYGMSNLLKIDSTLERGSTFSIVLPKM